MNAIRQAFAMAAMLSFVWTVHGASPTLSVRDMASWTLAIAVDASDTERYAAEEFQRLFREVTTIALPLRADGRDSTRSVVIGVAPSPSPSTEDEGFTIRIKPEQIEIEGGSARAVLYGVYAFAEQYLGVRFLSADNTYFPRDPGLSLPFGETRDTSVFSFRSCFYAELTGDASFAARLRINTVQGEAKLGGGTSQPLITHSLFRFVTVADYGAAHPEYFALVDGHRKLDSDGGGPQVCSTNPDVVDIVAQAVLREIAEQPDLKVVYVSQNDNGDYCECPACAAIDEREGAHMGAHLALVNAVAKRVAEKHPEVKVGTLAYWYTRRPPRFLKPEPNVQIQFCAFEKCPFHAIADRSCPRNRAIKR
ncbi:MAG: DUF4838 domain-containing protein, partial [Candidatus Hydrogenedentales bacterium]